MAEHRDGFHAWMVEVGSGCLVICRSSALKTNWRRLIGLWLTLQVLSWSTSMTTLMSCCTTSDAVMWFCRAFRLLTAPLTLCQVTYCTSDSFSNVASPAAAAATIAFCSTGICTPCGLRGCKNGPAPFPGRMSYKATKPGLVFVLYLSMFFVVLVFIRAPFYVLLVFIVCVLSFGYSS